MIKLALYGKGGSGKSTTAANLSAALSKKGLRVMQIGCDPKADSTQNLCGGRKISTVLDILKEKGMETRLEDVVAPGFNGICCVEAGGPTPGIGCAGRGIITAFETLERLNAYEVYLPDVVLYDVLGDVVCGGFAMPIRGGYADKVFVVTSGEKMSLYAAGNIALAIDNFKKRGYAQFGGVILNSRNIENELKIVENFADSVDTQIVKVIPRCADVQRAESQFKTVVEAFPESEMAQDYFDLAERVLAICAEGGPKA